MEYRIGEAARSVGMSVEGLRFYERRGLLKTPPRSFTYRSIVSRKMSPLSVSCV